MKSKTFSLKSFRYAFEGLFSLFKTEPNSRIHLLAACLATALGIAFRISAPEWLFVTAAIAGVFITELINSAIEKAADMIDPQYNPKIRLIKDMSAAGVLVAALASVVIGGVIFIPHLIELIK